MTNETREEIFLVQFKGVDGGWKGVLSEDTDTVGDIIEWASDLYEHFSDMRAFRITLENGIPTEVQDIKEELQQIATQLFLGDAVQAEDLPEWVDLIGLDRDEYRRELNDVQDTRHPDQC